MYRWLAHRAIAAPIQTIVLVSLLALVLLAGLKNTHFVSDFDSTLPDRSILTRQALDNHARFGGRNTLAFLVSGGSPASRTVASCTLTRELQQLPGISSGQVYGVGSDSLKMVRSDSSGMVVEGLSALCDLPGGLTADLKQSLGPQSALVLAPNGDLIVTADINLSSGEFGPLIAQIERVIDRIKEPGVNIAYSGQPAFLAQNDVYSKRIALFFPIIMLLVLVMHWEALRSVQAVVVPIFTGLGATLMALGAYGWLHLSLDTYTVLAPILILAVGAGHSVQLLKRYMEEVRQRTPVGNRVTTTANADALRMTMVEMGPVLTLAVVGASTCLFALLLLGVAALARFGLLAGMGIIAALILELTLVPAIRILLPRPMVREKYGELSGWWQSVLAKVCFAALEWPVWRVAGLLGALFVVLALGVIKVHASHSMSVYTAPDVPVQKTLAAFRQAGVGPYAFDVAIDSGRDGDAFLPKITRSAAGLAKELSQDAEVRAVLLAPTTIGYVRCHFSGDAACDPTDAGSADEARQTWTVLLGNAHDAGFFDANERYLRLRALVRSDETSTAARLIDISQTYARNHHLTVTFGGSAVTAKALADGIVNVSVEKAILLIAIVFIMGGAVFRSIKMAFIFAVPAIATVAANFAWLGWSGTSLNVATAAVATITVGVGLDYLIYLSFRIRGAQVAGHDYLDAIRIGHASAGGAAVCVGMAVAIGYAVLIFSPGYLVHHWVAVLVPITMLMSLFGALFIFPFLLRIIRPALGNADQSGGLAK